MQCSKTMPTRFLIDADKSIAEFIYRIQRTQTARTTLKRRHNWRIALPDLMPQRPRQRSTGDGAKLFILGEIAIILAGLLDAKLAELGVEDED